MGRDMAQGETVLVRGATGGIGGEIARRLRDAGWRVHGLRRGPGASKGGGIEWFTAMR